jgi:hypothetical protein
MYNRFLLIETGGETLTILLLKEIKNYTNFTQIYKKLQGSQPCTRGGLQTWLCSILVEKE